MSGRIDILLPGLFHLPLHELDSAPAMQEMHALNRLLRFASAHPGRALDIDAALGEILGIENRSASGLPLAQAWADDDRNPLRLQLIQPVYLHADLHAALLMPIPENEENIKDISNLINDLSEVFKVDCDISAVSDGAFLMHLHEFDAPLHYPHLLSMLGRPVNPYIEQSRDHLPWYRLINEMQMYLHQHPINASRVAQGRLPINSLWCWGGGARPASLERTPTWFCDDLSLNRFAASLGLPTMSLAELDTASSADDIAVVDLRLLRLLKTGSVDSLDSALLAIEREVIAPSLRVAESGRRRLRLSAGTSRDYCLTPGAQLKFWRRPRNLAACSEAGDAL